MGMLEWLEGTGLALWIRESNTILAYPTILFLHTLGLATTAGLSAFLNLRVLGFAPTMPFAALRPFIRVIWMAFAVTAISGTALLIANASVKGRSPTFFVKLVFVAFAVLTLHLLAKKVFRNPLADQSPLPPDAKMLAALSLLFWIAATTAGRLMAYLG